MKTRSLVSIGVAALTLGACATWEWRHPGVEIHETYIEIHPGTKIAPEDQAKLDQILSHYKTKLYKIQKRERDASFVSIRGSLSDVHIKKTLLADVENWVKGGVPYSALQIGVSCHRDHAFFPNHAPVPDHAPCPDHAPVPDRVTKEDLVKSDQLVKRVTPILKNYSRD